MTVLWRTIAVVLFLFRNVEAFLPSSTTSSRRVAFVRLHAGGFEWEDPQNAFDQGVDNPFKNPNLTGGPDGMKIDPARLLGPRLSGSNVYLIGMMGSGKTAVGDLMARRMGTYNFLDTDQIIETAAGMSIPEIFKQEGEAAFRDLEAQVLDTVHAYVRCVVSTGGGIVERMENWSKLQSGIVVWLNVDPQVIVDRLTKKGGIENRPLLQTDDPAKTLKDLLDRRQSKYAQADVTICIDSADSTEDDVADKVIRELHDFIDDNPPAWKTAKAKAQAEGLDWVQ